MDMDLQGKLIIKDGILYIRMPDESLERIGKVTSTNPITVEVKFELPENVWDTPPVKLEISSNG